MLKKILLILVIVLVIIQFIRPHKNISEGPQPNAIQTRYELPPNVKIILDRACMDCHGNNTRYPWYDKIQPVAWFLARHVNEGKDGLNLDEFTNMPAGKQYHKMEEITEQVKEGEMPITSYTWTHGDAKLNTSEKEAIYGWVANVRASMEAAYPKDSLVIPKKKD
jgi:hypothetical protein